jgi:hypothetical protein
MFKRPLISIRPNPEDIMAIKPVRDEPCPRNCPFLNTEWKGPQDPETLKEPATRIGKLMRPFYRLAGKLLLTGPKYELCKLTTYAGMCPINEFTMAAEDIKTYTPRPQELGCRSEVRVETDEHATYVWIGNDLRPIGPIPRHSD